MSELNKTLKTYLENLMRHVSPDSEDVIESESTRLSEIDRIEKLRRNDFMHYMTFGNRKIPFEVARTIMVDATDINDLQNKLKHLLKADDYKRLGIDDILSNRGVMEDINDCRVILGLQRFPITDNTKIAERNPRRRN